MKPPGVGEIVTVVRYVGKPTRAEVVRCYKRRFIVRVREVACTATGDSFTYEQTFSFERNEENRTWTLGWDTFNAIAWRAEYALASCR